MTELIKGGRIITAADSYEADLRIDGERVVEIGVDLQAGSGDKVTDAGGCYVMPGGVDVHTHFDLPVAGTRSADDFESGTRAAAVGGTTCVIDHATPEAGQSLMETLDIWHAKAEGRSAIDYGFHMALTSFDDVVAKEMAELSDAGVTSFKAYMAYARLMVDDGTLLKVLRRAGEVGGLILVHAENGHILDLCAADARARGRLEARHHPELHPAVAEVEATARAIRLAEAAGEPLYVVHVSCAGALSQIRHARGRGQTVYGETCPHYLVLSDELYQVGGFEASRWIMSPPLRGAADQRALWTGLRDGGLQTVATDHCSFRFHDQKRLGEKDVTQVPNGIASVGDRFGLLWTAGVAAGRLSPQRFVELIATAPARLFGLYPAKGTIAVGSDADLVVFDPAVRGTISAETTLHAIDYSAFEGYVLKGMPRYVYSRGSLVARKGKFVGGLDHGQYVSRGPFQAI